MNYLQVSKKLSKKKSSNLAIMAGIPASGMGQPCMYNDPSSVYVKTEYDQGKNWIWKLKFRFSKKVMKNCQNIPVDFDN